jgi:hypothetical protein
MRSVLIGERVGTAINKPIYYTAPFMSLRYTYLSPWTLLLHMSCNLGANVLYF